jgi:RNA polymerase sigma-54 factor
MNRYNDARDFIRILNQRQETMMTVMTAIVNIQKEYFLTEDVYKLRPMIIRNIAEITGLDISVISRATTNKFVATPWGMLPLRFFFSDTIGEDTGDTDAATNRKIEAQIAALVAAEDKRHPLSDQKIMEEMVAQGYNLSRRTVAKYRDRKGIPVARLRKEL